MNRLSQALALVFLVQPPTSPAASPPVFIAQPSDVNATAGLEWELTASASGSGPLTFQWYKDDAPLPGATNGTLSDASAEFGDAGQYYVVASDNAASATSRVAQVTVSAFNWVSGPYDTEALLGNPVYLST